MSENISLIGEKAGHSMVHNLDIVWMYIKKYVVIMLENRSSMAYNMVSDKCMSENMSLMTYNKVSYKCMTELTAHIKIDTYLSQ